MENTGIPRKALLAIVALLAGGGLAYYLLRPPPEKPAEKRITVTPPAVLAPAPDRVAGNAKVVPPPLLLWQAPSLSPAEMARKLAAWPEELVTGDTAVWSDLLAARGAAAIPEISRALTSAETNAGRRILSDALAKIGTDEAVQELCTQAVKAPDGEPRKAIAGSFSALTRPAAVPHLVPLLAESDSTALVTGASDAIRRLADRAGIETLADLSQEGGPLYSQRDAVLRLLSTIENPEALTALEVIAADGTDTARADAAREGASRLRRKLKAPQ